MKHSTDAISHADLLQAIEDMKVSRTVVEYRLGPRTLRAVAMVSGATIGLASAVAGVDGAVLALAAGLVGFGIGRKAG